MVAHILLTLALALYCTGAGLLYLYGLNCFVMIGLFLRGRAQRQAEDEQIRRRFVA